MTKGYKATYNYKCLNQTYEIGQEYKLNEKPILCQSGFHYCLDAKDTLTYYAYNHEFKLLEIEDLSNYTITEGLKSCSNHIKIIREISDPDELFQLLGCIKTFDENGKELTRKDLQDNWRKCTFNEKGQLLTYEDSDGYWSVRTYNENGNALTYKASNGYWQEYTYNENGQELTFKDSIGDFCEYTYDSDGNVLTQNKCLTN